MLLNIILIMYNKVEIPGNTLIIDIKFQNVSRFSLNFSRPSIFIVCNSKTQVFSRK